MSLRNYDLKSMITDAVLDTDFSDSPNCIIPLFHGTDRDLYVMGAEKRQALRMACGIVINFLLPIYESHNFEAISSQNKIRAMVVLCFKNEVDFNSNVLFNNINDILTVQGELSFIQTP